MKLTGKELRTALEKAHSGVCKVSHKWNDYFDNEEELIQARNDALSEMEQRAAAMGANAIVGVDVDYEVLGQGNMFMVSASGTAVVAKAK